MIAVGVLSFHAPATRGSVATFRLTLHDVRRNRDVPVYAVVPTGPGPYPAVVMSHGNDSGGREMKYLFAAWAARGYACLAPTHDDSTSLRKASEAAGPTTVPLPPTGVVEPRGAGVPYVLSRAADLSFVIDALPEIAERTGCRIDAGRVGIGGVSFGAYTAMLAAGVTAGMDGVPRTARDPRPRAFLFMAGMGSGQGGLTPASWRGLDRPAMDVIGLQDIVPRGGTIAGKREAFALSPAGDKFAVTIPDANHGSFRCDPSATFYATMPGGSADRQRVVFDAVEAATGTFWDAYLKGDGRAAADLRTGEGSRRFPDVTVEAR